MKVLILSMTCGQGHNMIAKSLSEQFDKLKIENKIVRIFDFDTKLATKRNKLNTMVRKYVPHIYDFVWNALRKKNRQRDKLFEGLNKCIPFAKSQIEEFKPNIIISTSVNAAALIGYMKKHEMFDNSILTSAILHDIVVAPNWQYSNNVDYIFQPYENTTEQLLSKGFKKEQIKTFGLPVRKQFVELDKSINYKEKLGLPNKFSVLAISGGGGISGLKLIKKLLKINLDIQIVLINGKNKKNFDKMESFVKKHEIKNLTNLGFVTNIEEYFMACDTCITACGSGATSELLVMNKPFITRKKMIVNEKITQDFLAEKRIALKMEKISDAEQHIKQLMNPEIYKTMQQNAITYARPNAAKDIVQFLVKTKNSEK